MCLHEQTHPWDRVRPSFLHSIIMGWPLINGYKGMEEKKATQ